MQEAMQNTLLSKQVYVNVAMGTTDTEENSQQTVEPKENETVQISGIIEGNTQQNLNNRDTMLNSKAGEFSMPLSRSQKKKQMQREKKFLVRANESAEKSDAPSHNLRTTVIQKVKYANHLLEHKENCK